MAVLSWADAVDIGGGRGRLAAPAAASLGRVDAVVRDAFGRVLDINEAWRSPEQANSNYAAYLWYLRGGPWAPIALPADKSVHCVGFAIDTDDSWLVAILNDHGWYQTVYRWVNGVWTLVEPWHFEYFAERDNHRYEGSPAGGNGVDMPLAGDGDKQFIKDALYEFMRDTGANIKGDGTSAYKFVSDAVWGQPIQAQDARGNGIVDAAGNPVRYAALGYLASINAQVGALLAVVKDLALTKGLDSDDLVKVIEDAAERGAREALSTLVLVPAAQ